MRDSKRILNATIAALLSLVFAGAGQVYNRQWVKGLVMAIAAIALWFVLLGWVVQIWAIADAAVVGWSRPGLGDTSSVSGWRAFGLKVCVFVVVLVLGMTVLSLWYPELTGFR